MTISPQGEACASVLLEGAIQIRQQPIEGGTATVDCGGVSLHTLNVIRALEYGLACSEAAIRQVLCGEFGPLGVAVERQRHLNGKG